MSFHHHTIQWRLVALYIGHPEAIRLSPGELSVDEIQRCRHPRDPASGSTVPGKTGQASTGHEHPNSAVADCDAVPIVSSAWTL